MTRHRRASATWFEILATVSVLVLFSGVGHRCLGEDATSTTTREFLCANLGTRVLLIAPDGTVSVVADVSTRLTSIGSDGRAFALNRSHTGDLKICRLAPGKICRNEDVQTLCVFDELKFFSGSAVMPAPQGDVIAALGNPRAFDPDRPASCVTNIYLLEPQQRLVTPLTSFAGDYGGGVEVMKWSPDGSKIAFYYAATSGAPGPPDTFFALYVVTREGVVRRLADETLLRSYSGHGADVYEGPVWSADSATVFFVGHQGSEDPTTPTGYPVTYAVSANGGEIRRIGLGNPWSVTPDGQYLYCSAGWPDSTEFPCVRRRVDLNTGDHQALGPDWRMPLVSPSGRYVACFPSRAITIFTAEGKELGRIDEENHELLKLGMGIISWVEVK